MEWLSGLAPTLFNALTGNIPGAIASAVGFIAEKTGVINNADDIKKYLNTLTPEQQLKFAEYDIEFSREETKRLQAQLLDVQSARSREIEMAKLGIRDYVTPILAFVFVIMFFLMIWFACKHVIPVENQNIIALLIGQLSGIAGSVATYYFGSSKSSSDKNKIFESMGKMNIR